MSCQCSLELISCHRKHSVFMYMKSGYNVLCGFRTGGLQMKVKNEEEQGKSVFLYDPRQADQYTSVLAVSLPEFNRLEVTLCNPLAIELKVRVKLLGAGFTQLNYPLIALPPKTTRHATIVHLEAHSTNTHLNTAGVEVVLSEAFRIRFPLALSIPIIPSQPLLSLHEDNPLYWIMYAGQTPHPFHIKLKGMPPNEQAQVKYTINSSRHDSKTIPPHFLTDILTMDSRLHCKLRNQSSFGIELTLDDNVINPVNCNVEGKWTVSLVYSLLQSEDISRTLQVQLKTFVLQPIALTLPISVKVIDEHDCIVSMMLHNELADKTIVAITHHGDILWRACARTTHLLQVRVKRLPLAEENVQSIISSLTEDQLEQCNRMNRLQLVSWFHLRSELNDLQYQIVETKCSGSLFAAILPQTTLKSLSFLSCKALVRLL